MVARQVDYAMCRLLVRTSVTMWRLLSSSHVARSRIALALVNWSIPGIASVPVQSCVHVGVGACDNQP